MSPPQDKPAGGRPTMARARYHGLAPAQTPCQTSVRSVTPPRPVGRTRVACRPCRLRRNLPLTLDALAATAALIPRRPRPTASSGPPPARARRTSPPPSTPSAPTSAAPTTRAARPPPPAGARSTGTASPIRARMIWMDSESRSVETRLSRSHRQLVGSDLVNVGEQHGDLYTVTFGRRPIVARFRDEVFETWRLQGEPRVAAPHQGGTDPDPSFPLASLNWISTSAAGHAPGSARANVTSARADSTLDAPHCCPATSTCG